MFHVYFSWTDVFYDLESGIRNYLLEIGSEPNFGDIVQSIETTEDCGVSIEFLNKEAHQGHVYFITAKGGFNNSVTLSCLYICSFDYLTNKIRFDHIIVVKIYSNLYSSIKKHLSYDNF